MAAESLITEGERLVRPSLLLREATAPGTAVGFWKGRGIVPPPPGDYSHWLSLDCSWLSKHGFPVSGCLSVYKEENGGPWVAVHDPNRIFLAGTGIPLAGEEAPSFPPLPALCLYGSTAVEEWLTALQRSREEYDAPDVYGSDEGEAYAQAFRERSPAYRDDVAVILGGWQMSWPDEDAYDAAGASRLVLWTLRDAAPWVEVWAGTTGALEVRPHYE